MIRLAGLQRFAAPLGSMKKGSGSAALRCLHSARTSEPRDHDLTNGDALCLGLRAAGVSAVFGIPGTHMNAFYHCLQRLSELGEAELADEEEALRMTHVTARHEGGAAFAAEGYARATGRPAAAATITGVGVVNFRYE